MRTTSRTPPNSSRCAPGATREREELRAEALGESRGELCARPGRGRGRPSHRRHSTRKGTSSDQTRRPAELAQIAKRVTEFWRNVSIRGDNECWPWTGYLNEDGYGEFYFAGEMRGSHELAVTFSTGEVRDPALDTCHSCDNPPCCNPGHVR